MTLHVKLVDVRANNSGVDDGAWSQILFLLILCSQEKTFVMRLNSEQLILCCEVNVP